MQRTQTFVPAAGDSRPTPGKLAGSLRLFSLPLSVLPVLTATAAAAPPARWHLPALLAAAAASALLHLGGNLLNDYFDFVYGVDRRLHDDDGRPGRLLVAGRLSPGVYLAEAGICLALAALLSGWLVWRTGPALLGFALAAAALLWSYTGPPLHLKYRALGEAAIFPAFGPLLMAAAAWVQTGGWNRQALLISLPVGLATTAILVGNNLRDREEDSRGRIRTLAHLGGGGAARGLYVFCVATAAAGPALLAAIGWSPPWLAGSLLSAPLLARPLGSILGKRRAADIDVQTARFAAAMMLLICCGYLLSWLRVGN